MTISSTDHCISKDTVAQIHRIIVSIVIFDIFFLGQITISFLLEENPFAGKTALFFDNVPGLLSVLSNFYVKLVLMIALPNLLKEQTSEDTKGEIMNIPKKVANQKNPKKLSSVKIAKKLSLKGI